MNADHPNPVWIYTLKHRPGELPRIGATVDGVRVTWRRRDDPAVGRWRCEEHDRLQRCEHVLAVLPHLPADLAKKVQPLDPVQKPHPPPSQRRLVTGTEHWTSGGGHR